MKRFLIIITISVIGFALFLSPRMLYAEPSKNPGIININAGDVKALSTLPGIGKSTAKKIIQYRTERGKFKKKEEIINVKGISANKYEKIKDLIVVSDEENTQNRKE